MTTTLTMVARDHARVRMEDILYLRNLVGCQWQSQLQDSKNKKEYLRIIEMHRFGLALPFA